MKNLMLTTAVFVGVAGAAFAQDSASAFRAAADPMNVRASEFIGMRIYASEAALDATEYNGAQEGWDDIGEINDVILSRDGKVDAVLVDIGGFLGMGERQVAVGMEAVKFVSDSATADNPDDFFLVMAAKRADFEAAPPYMMNGDAAANGAANTGATATTETEAAATSDTGAAGTSDTGTAGTSDTGTAATSDTGAAATSETGTAATSDTGTAATSGTAPAATEAPATDAMAAGAERKAMVREGYVAADDAFLTSEKLTGAKVYDGADAAIGEVSDLVLSTDGKVTQVIVDVGGFLGMGAKPVALPMTDIDVLREAEGDDVRVYLSQTKEQLEAMPDYQK